jgi:hypothetical protein
VTLDRFTNLGEFSSVIGIDRDEKALTLAALRCPARWAFLVASIEDEQASNTIRELMSLRPQPEQPVFAFLAFVLMHLAKPVEALRVLQNNLPTGSKVLVRTMDDGLHLAYPDHEDLMEPILNPAGSKLSGGDRHSGRKLYRQLHQAGFRDITLFVEPIISSSLTEAERKSMFHVLYSWRADELRDIVTKDPSRQDVRHQMKTAEAALAGLERSLNNPEFLIITAGLGAVATVE